MPGVWEKADGWRTARLLKFFFSKKIRNSWKPYDRLVAWIGDWDSVILWFSLEISTTAVKWTTALFSRRLHDLHHCILDIWLAIFLLTVETRYRRNPTEPNSYTFWTVLNQHVQTILQRESWSDETTWMKFDANFRLRAILNDLFKHFLQKSVHFVYFWEKSQWRNGKRLREIC